MPIRKANAEWSGNLAYGKGIMKFGSGFEGAYSAASRFEEGPGTNPEELIGAAHAGCFSMAFADVLAQEGFEPENIKTEAKVEIVKGENGFEIKSVHLTTSGVVQGISENKFSKFAEDAKKNCPVSQALKGVDISVEAKLDVTKK